MLESCPCLDHPSAEWYAFLDTIEQIRLLACISEI